MGQLTGANLPGLTCAYTYDGAGNLLTASNGTTTNTYTYGNASWKDLLTAFNGEKIVYEGQTLDENGSVTGTPTSGNPTSYFNGTRWNLGWAEGRSLREAASGTPEQDTALNFAYDVNGLRTEKQVTRTVYEMTTEHTYAATVVAPTCTEGGYTLHECSCGDSYQDTETAALGHDYTSSGEGTLTCTRCGDTIEHTHNYTVTVVPPTCTTGGYTLHECSCGDSYQDAATPALGHNFRNDPTTGGQKCRRCGYIEIPIEIPTSHGELMSLEEPTEPDALMLNEPENESEDGNSGQALHRGTATEITTDHSYIYAGGKLLRETITGGTNTKTLDFTYDNVGMPYSLTYNNGTTTTTYYYITNLQGDVMYLVDANGNEVAAYDYDPYGKIISATGSMAEVNPLRYRGYYYDSETGFYYLQSRYYDPEICRFINADKYSSTGLGFLGHNMFAYCNNSPLIHTDKAGSIPAYSLMLTDSGPAATFIPALNGRNSSFSTQTTNGDRRTTVTYDLIYYSPKQVNEKVQKESLAAYTKGPGLDGFGKVLIGEAVGFLTGKTQKRAPAYFGRMIQIITIVVHLLEKGKACIDATRARFWVSASQSGKGVIEVHFSAYGTSGCYYILWDESGEQQGFGSYPMARR